MAAHIYGIYQLHKKIDVLICISNLLFSINKWQQYQQHKILIYPKSIPFNYKKCDTVLMILRNSPSMSLSEINLLPPATELLIDLACKPFPEIGPIIGDMVTFYIWSNHTSLSLSQDLPKSPQTNFNINSNYEDIISGHTWHDSHCSSERARPELDWRCWCGELACVLSLYPVKKRHKKQFIIFL